MNASRKRRTIYFVWNYLNWGGAQIYLLAVMKLAKPDWDMLVLLPRGSSSELLGFLEKVGVPYEFLEHALENAPAVTFAEKLARQRSRIRSEREIYRRLSSIDLRNNILHIEIAPWQSWLLLALLDRRGANIFITLHNFLTGGGKARQLIWKRRLRFVSRLKGVHVFASNRDCKDRFRGWFTDEFHDRIKVTYTSVNPEEIEQARKADQQHLRNQYSLPEDKFIVLCVGQFVDRKGRWVFLDAAKQAAARGDESLMFVWLMPQPPDAEAMQRIKGYGLGDRFRFFVSPEIAKDRLGVLQFFNIADAFALSSFIEGLPIALLEAMAIGLPSISTNVFAIPEAIIDGKTGLLIEPGDGGSLYTAIHRLAAEPELRKSLASAGREHVLENFDERVAAAEVLASYRACFDD